MEHYTPPRLAVLRHRLRTAEIACHPAYLFLGFAVAIAAGHLLAVIQSAGCQ